MRKATQTKQNCFAGSATKKRRYNNSPTICDGKMAATADSLFIYSFPNMKQTSPYQKVKNYVISTFMIEVKGKDRKWESHISVYGVEAFDFI